MYQLVLDPLGEANLNKKGQTYHSKGFCLKTLLLIPVLNEREALMLMMPQLQAWRLCDVLFIDGGSTDGSLDDLAVLRKVSTAVDFFVLLQSREQGLGAAYKEGFVWAMHHGYSAVIQMDADGSHRLDDVARIHRRLEHIPAIFGSRFIAGAKFLGSSFLRKRLSRWGSSFWRWSLKVPVSDISGGLNGWHLELLESLPLESLNAGYPFQAELKTLWHTSGYSFEEIPISFEKRVAGKSKFTTSQVWYALQLWWHLLWKKKAFSNG